VVVFNPSKYAQVVSYISNHFGCFTMASSFPRIQLLDVGSFPLDADMLRYVKGARMIESDPKSEYKDAFYFIAKHNEAFRLKAEAMGPDASVTSFAQCRGMISQYLEPLFMEVAGEEDLESEKLVTKSNAQRVAAEIAMGQISLDNFPTRVAEVIALERGAEDLSQGLGVDAVSYKACITGPLELTLNLQRLAGFPRGYDEKLMEFFTELVEKYVRGALVSSPHLRPEVITMDDPSFGLEGLGDFFTDTKRDDSLNHMISCWNRIYANVPRDVYRGLHLHTSPYEHLFAADWNLLEAHVDVYVDSDWLIDSNKFVRAAIMRTDGPSFSSDVDLKAAWEEIKKGNFSNYLQAPAEMKRYLDKTLKLYGSDKVPFAGPECGLGPWDWRNGAEMALSNLRAMRSILPT
jgi:methionine synthase II (cobalamin-independent)